MSFDESDRPEGFDPRFSESFQRGGHGGSTRYSTPSSAADSGDRGPSGFDELEEMLERDSAADSPGSTDADRAAESAHDMAALHRALAFLRRWGVGLVIAGVGMTILGAVMSVANQNSFSGLPSFEQQFGWAVVSLLVTISPLTIVLGVAVLLYAGYRSRLSRRGEGAPQ